MNASVIASAASHVTIAAAAPWIAFLGSAGDITGRQIAATAVASLVTGCTALLAFLNTSAASVPPAPPSVLNPSKL